MNMRRSPIVFLIFILAVFQVGARVSAEEMGSYTPPVERAAEAPPELKIKDKEGARKLFQLTPPSDIEVQKLKENNSRPKGLDNDAPSEQKALNIGFGRAVPLALGSAISPQQLNWQPLASGGMAAQFSISSPGAAALRLALAIVKMPEGVELRFVGSGNPNVVLGPVTSVQVLGQTPYWSPIVEGDSLTVEIYLPPGVAPTDIDFSAVMLSHLVSSPVKLDMQALQPKVAGAAAACELDAVCHYNTPTVQSAATSVALMIFTNPLSGLSYSCTGTLLNSRTPSIPYFYSANHCISDQATANTLVTYWFYESSACNSPTVSSQTRTLYNGAALLYKDRVSDVAFLRLNDQAPAGATFAGWDSTPVVTGDSNVGLHHPRADFTKISFSTVTNPSAMLVNLLGGRFIKIVHSQGITESGSSGSGLFTLNSATGQYQLRGGLYGGTSSCTNPSGPDYYSRFDLAYPSISGFLNQEQTDVRAYIPAADAVGGYTSYLRIINKGSVATPVTVTAIEGLLGWTIATGTLTSSLPPQAAVNFSAQQVEAALGYSFPAGNRPRIRVSANTPIDVQSYLLQPGGAFNEISDALGGASSIIVQNYVPAALSPSGYMSYLRVINTGTSSTAITVAKIDPATGQTGAAGTLISWLAAKGAVTFSAQQVEAALGSPIPASERPRILVSGVNTLLDVQTFLLQPNGSFANHSGGRSGSTVDVPNYVPAATVGYTSYLRVINTGTTAAPVYVALIDDVTGSVGAPTLLVSSLPAHAAMTLTSAQVETALGTQISATSRPRIRVSSSVELKVQSFLLQPGGAFNEISNAAASGTSVDVRTYIPAADAPSGYTSYLRVINTGAVATPITVALIDGATGAVGAASTLIASLPAGGGSTLSSSQVEAALGTSIASGSRPRLRVTGNTVLEVQSYLTQPGGAFTEVSGGQSGSD